MSVPKISVIIPTYHDQERLIQCLNALKKQTFSQDLFEVIVVNNGPPDSIRKDDSWAPNVNLYHEPIPGSYAARNRGAEAARGTILAFTDSDCIPDSNWLLEADKKFEFENCDLIGGNIEIFRNEGGSKMLYYYEKQHLFKQEENVSRGYSVTANLFVKKSCFQQAGGFDTSIKSMGDFEFTGRCYESGFKISYGKDAMVRHPAREKLNQFFNRRYRITCWKEINAELINQSRFLRLRSIIIKYILGLKKVITRRSETGEITESLSIKYISLLETHYETGVRLAILFGLTDPYKAR